METTLQVLDIQRLSTEDGPGLRTTVFLKGCPLRCAWCHNPESIRPQRELVWVGAHCIGCGLCVKACPNQAASLDQTGLHRGRGCTGCAACGEACPTGANEIKGEEWDIAALHKELVKDAVYFRESGGGVTVSGGDPLLQAAPVAALLEGLRADGIHTALDSALLTTPALLDKVLPHVDLLLLDLKLCDDEQHRKWTGVSNRPILDCARHVANRMGEGKGPAKLWLRTPVIPGATDRPENIRGIARFVAGYLRGAYDRWELCAFNNLCRDKYSRMGQDWPFADTPLMEAAALDSLVAAAREILGDDTTINWTGSVRIEEETA